MSNMISLPVPLPSGHQASFTVPQPLSEEDFKHLSDLLRVMKPGLVAKPVDAPAPTNWGDQ